MTGLIKLVEKELKIPKERLIQEGLRCFLEVELKNLAIQIEKLAVQYGVKSFEELWKKLEVGEITESECFEDLSKLEFLELEKDKVIKLLKKAA